MKPIIKIKKKNFFYVLIMWWDPNIYCWPSSDLFIGRHLIHFFSRNLSKTVLAILTACLVMVILYISWVLSVCQYGLSGLDTACLLGV